MPPERNIVSKPIAGPSPSFIERMRGRRTSDIELPNNTGKVDERLKRRKRGLFDKLEDFKEATGTKR